jgi:transcription elongation GreA/GreB family factor
VKFGATVVLIDEDTEEKRYQIVGDQEADVKWAASRSRRRSPGR